MLSALILLVLFAVAAAVGELSGAIRAGDAREMGERT
jgi:hypothetical protein